MMYFFKSKDGVVHEDRVFKMTVGLATHLSMKYSHSTQVLLVIMDD